MQSPSLTRVVVSAGNLQRALGFYADLLGLPVIDRNAATATLVAGGTTELFLHQRPSVPSVAAVAACFTIEDLDETVAKWRGRDGVIIDPPSEQPWGERMAVVEDPDGHMVCLVEATG